MDVDAIIFNSEVMRNDALTVMPYLTNTHVIYNGADDSCFYPSSSRTPDTSPPLVLFVGRLVPIKGVHVLVEAIRLLNQWNVPVRCKIVGSSHTGSDNTKKTAYIRGLRLQAPSNITFLGFRAAADLGDEYRTADIFCCPSVWREPFGNVNVEAMACGLPVVATRVGGIPEIASEGGVVLVEPDSPIALAEALRILISNSSERRRLGLEALKAFRHRFTWTTIARQHEDLISNLSDFRSAT
jgi:spore coat protein SA